MSTSVASPAEVLSSSRTEHRAKRFYAPELDILRFGAFLLVFCRHFSNALGFARNQADTGNDTARALAVQQAVPHLSAHSNWEFVREALQSLDFGVCLFFFLSAFLITRLLLLEKNRTGNISVREFYIRRCLRIWPLYFTFLLLILLGSHFTSVLYVDRARFLAAIFFVANWAAVLHGWSGIAIQPLWSVSVEEQFYLIWPLFSRIGRNAVIAISSASVGMALITLMRLGQHSGAVVTQTWPNTLVQVLFLAGGALTACFSFPERRRLATPVRALLILCGLLLWVFASAVCHVVRVQSPDALLLVSGYLLVLAGTFSIFTGVAGWTAASLHPWLISLGKMSYGLYVFHLACFLLMQRFVAALLHHARGLMSSPYMQTCLSALAAFGLTIVCAVVSYRYLESPFLRLKERFTVVTSRPAD